MAQFKGQLPSGKPFLVAITTDADDFDFLCLHGQINAMRDQIHAARVQRGPSIALPNGQLIAVKPS